MKVLLALLVGAAAGLAAVRIRRPALTAPVATAGAIEVGPGRVAVDVSAFAD
jgi:hypothetical protein